MSYRDSLKQSFEAYMRVFYQEHGRFAFNDFVDFAVTLLNYNINAQIISAQDKREAAYYLTTLYNRGMGNRITEADLQRITDMIVTDYALDMQILQRILG